MTSQHRPKDCSATLRLLDDFLVGELSIECNQEILSHLEGCPACEAERHFREKLRSQLRESWVGRKASSELKQRVMSELQAQDRSSAPAVMLRWAAGLVLVVAASFLFSQAWFSLNVEAIDHFDQAIRDHVDCEHPEALPAGALPISEREAEDVLVRLSSLVDDGSVPERFNAYYHHRCEKDGVSFVHYKFCQDDSSEIVPCTQGQSSVSMILEKRARSQVMSERDGPTRLDLDGTRALLFVKDEHSMVSFVSGGFFVYIVSDRITPKPFALSAAEGILSTLGNPL